MKWASKFIRRHLAESYLKSPSFVISHNKTQHISIARGLSQHVVMFGCIKIVATAMITDFVYFILRTMVHVDMITSEPINIELPECINVLSINKKAK